MNNFKKFEQFAERNWWVPSIVILFAGLIVYAIWPHLEQVWVFILIAIVVAPVRYFKIREERKTRDESDDQQ